MTEKYIFINFLAIYNKFKGMLHRRLNLNNFDNTDISNSELKIK